MDAVKANFDYIALIQSIESSLSKYKVNPKQQLDDLRDGLLSKEDALKSLSGSQLAIYKKQIEIVDQQRKEDEAELWLQERKKTGRKTEILWIYGQSGTGKTLFAKSYSDKLNTSCYISGSSKDLFQGYQGEHTIILDELRPTCFSYNDLLKILDPFAEKTYAPSRHHDKLLLADTYLITTPYNPQNFYWEIFQNQSAIDAFDQLRRRLTIVQYMTPDFIELQQYNLKTNRYEGKTESRKQNLLLQKQKMDFAAEPSSTYQKIIDSVLNQ